MKDLTYHISDILSGIYSLEGLEDRAFIEGLVHPDTVFDAVTYRGVPDIRIIVYRGVPAMGMVRLPTQASDGKANLHRGAIGVGIDMAEGTTLTGVHRSGVVTHHPDTNHPVKGIQVPYWKRMLLIAAKAVDMTGLELPGCGSGDRPGARPFASRTECTTGTPNPDCESGGSPQTPRTHRQGTS